MSLSEREKRRKRDIEGDQGRESKQKRVRKRGSRDKSKPEVELVDYSTAAAEFEIPSNILHDDASRPGRGRGRGRGRGVAREDRLYLRGRDANRGIADGLDNPYGARSAGIKPGRGPSVRRASGNRTARM
ncbi:hypothetical protein H632_c1874p1 [Helicosporidium sp. ATCC 50920]|nr:hypothetical protein H632_c1874p1 [Helicosporidium sp. ATCC 50920]|eukprot:KDD73747.1 hypothetical protein H632_c1874p1 [Helicosporidium sp. ATCC 50920]